jgi:hypothetical protein
MFNILNLPSPFDNAEYSSVGVCIAKIEAPGSNSVSELLLFLLYWTLYSEHHGVCSPKTKNNKVIIFFISLSMCLYSEIRKKKSPEE